MSFIILFFFQELKNLLFRLRDELNRSNEQVEEYRHMIYLLNEKNLTTNIDDLNQINYFDDDDDDDSRPIEKNFCLDDNTENQFIFLYSKPPVPSDDDNLSILSHLQNEIE
jgi:hypothetical protein